MKFWVGFVLYMFFCGAVMGTVMNNEYKRCGEVDVSKYKAEKYIFVPVAIVAAIFISDEAVESLKSACQEDK